MSKVNFLRREKVCVNYFNKVFSYLSESDQAFRLYSALLKLRKNNKRLRVFNSYPSLFNYLTNSSIDGFILGVSRLTDPAKTGGNKNLTFDFLHNTYFKSTREDVEYVNDLWNSITDELKKIRKARNKMIAHLGRNVDKSSLISEVSREEIRIVLDTLLEVLNIYFKVALDKFRMEGVLLNCPTKKFYFDVLMEKDINELYMEFYPELKGRLGKFFETKKYFNAKNELDEFLVQCCGHEASCPYNIFDFRLSDA